MTYFDINLDLTDEDRAIKEAVHKFAKQVMRPVSIEIDKMSAEESVAPGSPLWDFLKQGYALGYHKAAFPEVVWDLPPYRVTSCPRSSSGGAWA